MRLGICANVDCPPPGRLLGDAVADAAGIDLNADPWLPEHAVWSLLEVVDAEIDEPWLGGLASYLRGEHRRARRFSTIRHVAGLFDRYSLYRPEMLEAWARGESTHWQAELWRRLRASVDVPSPVERTEQACSRLRSKRDAVELPSRLSLFGLTRLPAGYLRVLEALAVHRDVHLLVLHPSPVLWDRLETAPGVVRRQQDHTANVVRNGLLASWGQESRELQLVLAKAERVAGHHHDVEDDETTLLQRIQGDVKNDRPPREQPAELDDDDRSVQVHACHGRARQVEVLRDAILHLLEEDDSLEPRDVIVMCPDIETFAPLIQATFGAGEVSPDDEYELDALPADVRPPDLRVRLADRSLRQTNPVLGVVSRLIELASERMTASQVLDLADREPVRRRFRFDDDDLTRIEDWVASSGIRWGLDAEHRKPFKLDGLPTNTWRAGIDRVLVGVTMTEERRRLFEDVLPVDDVDSRSIDLAGRFAELIDRLQAVLDSFATSKTMSGWAAAIGDAADALTATTQRDAWQRVQLQRILDDASNEARGAAAELTLGEVKTLLSDRLQGRPTRANFRTGSLTICTLLPMRSVPHRVVCLLGLDDGVFPRKAPRDGDDLLLGSPQVGERDSRTEDRQMLLDALLAARERLIITYTGNDERTNIAKPPAVPVGELLDVVERTANARERVHVRHPLQPFDPRNFTEGAIAGPRAWSFDRVTLEGARRLAEDRSPPPPFLGGELRPPPTELVEVDELVRFVEHPARAFLRKRLGVSVAEYDDEVEDGLPIELDGLEKWGVGQRMLEARLDGADIRAAYKAEIARGALPPGRLGQPVIEDLVPTVESIVEAANEFRIGEPHAADVSLDLDGRTVSGTVAGVHGAVLLRVIFSRVSPRHRIAAWVRMLAVTACGRPVQAVTVGRGPDGTVVASRVGPLVPSVARRRLAELIALYDRGMREPLAVACQTSAAFVAHGEAVARRTWTSEWGIDKEDRELEHQLVFGGVLDFDDLAQKRGFAEDAHALWDELLRAEAQ
jgi:exodeoxyribonuclease V gamma subunit